MLINFFLLCSWILWWLQGQQTTLNRTFSWYLGIASFNSERILPSLLNKMGSLGHGFLPSSQVIKCSHKPYMSAARMTSMTSAFCISWRLARCRLSNFGVPGACHDGSDFQGRGTFVLKWIFFQPLEHLQTSYDPNKYRKYPRSCVVPLLNTASTVHDFVSPPAQINCTLGHRPKPRYPYVGCDKMRTYRRLYKRLARNGRNVKKCWTDREPYNDSISNHREFCHSATCEISIQAWWVGSLQDHLQPMWVRKRNQNALQIMLHHKSWLPIHSNMKLRQERAKTIP